ncbi:MAG: hypothetical protein ABSF15_24705 [Candidatus Sulfotelmatobacter sp.]|jgi:hypothetical protein
MRGQYRENRTNRLYQWLTRRASFFHSQTSGRGTSRTVRTEVTVERQGMTLLVGGAAAGLDNCPLCGQKLAPAQAERAKLRLQECSIAQKDLPADGTSP